MRVIFYAPSRWLQLAERLDILTYHEYALTYENDREAE